MRTLFLGSPPFATPVLERLLASSHEVVGVVTPPDRRSGRGRALQRNPVAAAAHARGCPVLQPESMRAPESVAWLREQDPEVLAVASYGELLRTEVLELAPFGALNVHGSLLPRWRGASPVQAALLAGDTETGISIQQMVLELDAGDVLLERSTPIGAEETAGELAARLAVLGGEALVAALDAVEAGTVQPTPQDEAHITHCRKVPKEAGLMDFAATVQELGRLVRAMSPWPGASTTLPDGRRLQVLRLEPCAGRGEPGAVLEGPGLCVACRDGAVRLAEVKPAGKGAMEDAAFLRGTPLSPGTRLGGDPA
ncbi:MAG: methionyl-tRNA formyltransferase [Planctomycetes bacterium]|nr:methionyl-tRNA formyltransferase [Planctomycetota bacterium]